MPEPLEFEDFYRDSFRPLMKILMYAGATWHEAEDAVQDAMQELHQRWPEIEHPHAYARRAVRSSFLKIRDGERRRRGKEQVSAGDYENENGNENGNQDLTIWEDQQWVKQLLASLPPSQREVMTFVCDGFKPIEIARILGKTPNAVRQTLHAVRRRLMPALTPGSSTDLDWHEPTP
jgi:RNA polymerase sigma factor (sigma-70 family)